MLVKYIILVYRRTFERARGDSHLGEGGTRVGLGCVCATQAFKIANALTTERATQYEFN